MTGAVLSAIGIAWSLGLTSAAAWAALRSSRPRGDRRAGGERATLIRPCAGDEPALSRALGSTALAAGRTPLFVRFAVASADDGAHPIAELAADALRKQRVDARTVVTGAIGPNRKVDQLARVLAREQERTPVIIVADSDVNLAEVSLDELMAPLEDPCVAAVWAAPVETDPSTLADRASAAVLDGSLHAFRVLAPLDPAGMVGKLFAIRRDALDAVGGFGALVTYLGEDMELARRLRAAGWRTRLASFAVPSLAHGRSWSQAVLRYARWITVIRVQRTLLLWSYPGLFVATAPVLLLSFAATTLGGAHAFVAAILAVGARLFVGWLARARSGRPVRALSLPVDIVLADVLLSLAFVRAVCSRRTIWRGVELRADGQALTFAGGAQ